MTYDPLDQCDASAFAALFALRHGLRPRIGIEHEFYVFCIPDFARFQAAASAHLRNGNTIFRVITTEEGVGQFECISTPSDDVSQVLEAHAQMQNDLSQIAASLGGSIDWRAKPYLDRPSSGLHVHLSLHDASGLDVISRSDFASLAEDGAFRAAVGGLCRTMNTLTLAWAPTEECYRRFVMPPFPCVHFTPSFVSWGIDNRSTALRVVASRREASATRIEHRVPSAAAKLSGVLSAIFIGLLDGFSTAWSELPARTYGLACDPRLDLPRLPQTLRAALDIYEADGQALIRMWMSNCK